MSISVGGLVSGLDTNSIIDQLLALQQRPIVKLQQREAGYQVQLSAYGNLQSTLNSLKSAMEDLESVSDLTSLTASSGDTDLFTASAGDTATPGSYQITVTQMAKVHKLTSDGFDDQAVGEGTIDLTVGSGSTVNISVSDTDTIHDVAQAINDAEAGVQATVIFDGTSYFLTLSGQDTGEANKISLIVDDVDDEDKDNLGLSRLFYKDGDGSNQLFNTQSAADSIITIDGVADIQRDTNTIDDVIEGVTITLESEPDPAETATLTVNSDTSAVVSKIDSFVSAYNQVLDFFDTYQSYNPDTETAGVLLADATTNSIRYSFRNMVAGIVPGVESFDRLSDLGITLNDEGELEVDSSTLDDAIDDHFDDVVQFFTQSTEGSEGFAVRMVDALDAILKSTDGTLAARTDGIQDSIDDIQDQVERKEMRIYAWETRTRAEFQALELLLAQYQTTGDYLSQQITGFQNLSRYISNR